MKCSGKIKTGHWKGNPCCAVAKHEHNGKMYCKNHLPIPRQGQSTVKRRVRLLITNIKKIFEDGKRWEYQIGCDIENDGPWLTVGDNDLPRIPKIGDIVDVELPKVVGFKAS